MFHVITKFSCALCISDGVYPGLSRPRSPLPQMRALRVPVMQELEAALSRHAPPPVQDDPSRHELPPLVIDGIPTPVEKMTQAQLRAFIPLMLKYSTGEPATPGDSGELRGAAAEEPVPYTMVLADVCSYFDLRLEIWFDISVSI